MAAFKDISIRRKLAYGMTLVAGVALLLAALASLGYEAYSFRLSKVRQLTAVAEVVGQNSRAALTFADRAAATTTLASLKGIPGVDHACVFDPTGSVFAEYPEDAPQAAPAPPGGDHHSYGSGALEVYREIRSDSGLVGTVYLRSGQRDLWTALGWSLAFNAAIFAVLVLLALWISHRFQGVITAPLLALASLARRVSEEQDYSVRAAARGRDEIGSLVDAVNEMLKEIQARDGQLLDYREHLEDQVARRTEELLTSNQELLLAKQKAEEVSRAKSAFLANMSHELRTPLNAILLYSELLQEDAREQGRASDQVDLDRIHASGLHLLSLINDVLDLSKVEAGKMSLQLEPVDLGALVETCLQTIHPLAEKNGNVLEADVPKASVIFLGDAMKLRQALFNLLSNACKFTERGRVDLDTRIFQRDGARWLRCEVRDTGIGMTPEQQERIFQEFTQAEEGTSKRFGGTGLGLTLSRRLCQLMGGDICVVSAPGGGSTFTLEVPAPPATPAATGPAVGGRIRRVVVSVEDLSIPDGLARALGEAGFLLSPAAEKDGLHFTREDRPDGIVMDIAPPARNGEALLQEIHRREGWRDMPALLVASVALSAEEQSRLASAGVVAVLDASTQDAAGLPAMVAALVGPAEGRRVDA